MQFQGCLMSCLSIHPSLLPLFSPKYKVCCAVLDHCSEELSFSATWQVSVTVPPADTVSSDVTGCSGSSSRYRRHGRRIVIRLRVWERQQRPVRETRHLSENTSKNRCSHQHTKKINPQNALLALHSLFLSIAPPTISFSSCQIIYISLFVFLKART